MTDDRLMWGDDPLDENLREAAARYHEPGAVPRDAMWARIEALRAAARPTMAGDAASGTDTPRVIPLPLPGVQRSGRWWPRYAAGTAALAATLLVGVLIGRGWQDGGAGAGVANVPSAGTPIGVPGGAAPSGPAAGAAGEAAIDEPEAEHGRMVAGRPAPGDRGSTRAGATTAPGGAESAGADRMVPYRLAAVQHMSRAEALLTTFRVGARAGEVDAAIQPWARDLLSGTRLLLDSPAGDDLELRALLGDLELVLAQIVQLSAQRRAEEVQLIDRQLDADGVITRLRTAVPSGTIARGA
ncbi:MAG TPA: hypothetical protein VFZ11_09520 [Gemmatimonadaceae bacterium]